MRRNYAKRAGWCKLRGWEEKEKTMGFGLIRGRDSCLVLELNYLSVQYIEYGKVVSMSIEKFNVLLLAKWRDK